MYCDVCEEMVQTLAASVVSIYTVLGKPDSHTPDALAQEKLTLVYRHIRRLLGWDINTQSLMLSLPHDKHNKLISLLQKWVVCVTYQLLEAAEIHGLINQAAQANCKGRAMFFVFQNALQNNICTQYHQVKGYYQRAQCTDILNSQLPTNLHKRTDQLVACEMANLLWRGRANIKLNDRVRSELKLFLAPLANRSCPWSISIAHLVPQTENFVQIGDASELGGGAHSKILQVWFTALWSTCLRTAIKLHQKHPAAIHINTLKFVVCLLQLAATITALDDKNHMQKIFPAGVPPLPVLLIQSDNTASVNWCNTAVSSKSKSGQMFVHIYAELLERTDAAVKCEHIPGKKNVIADDLSRPPH